MDRWVLHVEPYPGAPTAIAGRSGDSLKAHASGIWRGISRWGEAEGVVFTICDPSGHEWQRCERVRGGSWRARWEWCSPSPAVPATAQPATDSLRALPRGGATS